MRLAVVLGMAVLMVCSEVSGRSPAGAAEAASPWINGHNSRARVLAGRLAGASGLTPYAFIEIELQPGWKTYWRTPGDSGGVPPQFDWSKSENIADMKVMYPAPMRLKEEMGDSVGYLDRVTFPIALKARDPSRPIGLAVVLEYGVCRDICIPAEAKLALEIAPGSTEVVPGGVSATLDRVPRLSSALRGEDPKLLSAKAEALDGKQRIVLTAQFPGGAASGEAFVEAPDGIYLPLPKRLEAGADGQAMFEVELGPYHDLKDLKDKKLTVTLVGARGESETMFEIAPIP